MTTAFRVGFGEVDITPPEGLLMCGGLDPRVNAGTDDPLMAKAVVVAGNRAKAAVVGVDLIGLPRAIVDQIIDETARRTDIEPDAIIISCSHTHSGPYTMEGLYAHDVTDRAYLSTLPGAIATSCMHADAALQPATLHVGRSLVHHGLHHRRVLCKDGKAYNTWMQAALDDLDNCPQIVGSCGPIDPELWVVRFDDLEGMPLGVLANLSLHANSHFGTRWSADYPGVIAEHVREKLGSGVVTVFTPGACANINPTMSGQRWREGAEYLAERAVEAIGRAKRVDGPIAVGAVRRDVSVPRRDPRSQPHGAIGRLTWGDRGSRPDVFEPLLDHVAEMPECLTVPVNAVGIGPFAIATNAGELFVEHGLTIKQRSPFPHTVVSELTNDLIMYQPTRDAFEQQGYETLVGPNRVPIEGIDLLVDSAVELLQTLWGRTKGDPR